MRAMHWVTVGVMLLAGCAWRSDAQEWSIRFDVSLKDSGSGETFTEAATSQARTGATDGFDGFSLDVPEAPPPPRGLRCYFIPTSGSNWPAGVDGYDVETKSSALVAGTPLTWKLVLTAHGGISGAAHLCWTPKDLPADGQAELLDTTTGNGYRLLAPSCLDVEVSATSGQSYLVVVTRGAATTYSIKGRVTSAGCGRPVPGATLRLDASTAAQTGEDGSYEFTGVGSGTHTVAPLQTSEAFNPTARQVNVNLLVGSATGADFELQDATAPVVQVLQPRQGARLPISQGLPFDFCWSYSETCPSSVEIRFQKEVSPGNIQSRLALTLSRNNVLPGDHQRCDKLTVGCDLPKLAPGYPLDLRILMTDEAGRQIETVVAEALAIANTYSVSGTVRDGCGNPMAGVSVKSGKVSATTDANGQYTLNGLSAGSATVSPQVTGYTFSPASRKVNLGCASPGATEVNFTAVDKLRPTVAILSPTKQAPVSVPPGGSFEVRWSYAESCPKAARVYWKSGGSKTLLAQLSQNELPPGTNEKTTAVTAPSTAKVGSTADLQVEVDDMAGNRGTATSSGCVKVAKSGTASSADATPSPPVRLTLVSVQRVGPRVTAAFVLSQQAVVEVRVLSPNGAMLLAMRSPLLSAGMRQFTWRPGPRALALCRESCVVELRAEDSQGHSSLVVRRTLSARRSRREPAQRTARSH